MSADEDMRTLTEKRFFDWEEDEVSVTLRNRGGGELRQRIRSVSCARVCGSLCARDYKGVGNQFVEEGKLIIVDYD